MESPEIPGSDENLQAANTSAISKAFNVFAAPGEVFDEVKMAPGLVMNWLLPLIISVIVGTIFSFVVFSQPNVIQQMREAQDKAMQQQVKDGKMTQAQADQAQAMVEKFTGPTVMKIFGVIGSLVGGFMRLFWWAFVIWMLARMFMKSPVPYMKVTEVVGLSTMVSVLGAIVTMFLIMSFGRLTATPSLGILVTNFDVANRAHLAMATVNLFQIWFLGILSVGLARLTGASFVKAAIFVFGFFLVWALVFIGLKVGTMVM